MGLWASVVTVLDEDDVFVELTGLELDVVVGARVLDVEESIEVIVELGLLDEGATLLLDEGADVDVDELMSREVSPPLLDEDEAAVRE